MFYVLLPFIALNWVLPGHAAQVHIRVPFYLENSYILTDAALELSEEQYGNRRWWAESDSENKLAKAINEVLAAIHAKDKVALLNLCDPEQGRDPVQFEQQVRMLFEQEKFADPLAIPFVYEINGLLIAFTQHKFNKRVFYSGWVFTRRTDGTIGYLPYKTESTSYAIVRNWFNSQKEHSTPDASMYLSDEDYKKATHRFILNAGEKSKEGTRHPGILSVRGFAITKKSTDSDLAEEVKGTLEAMKTALDKSDVPTFVQNVVSTSKQAHTEALAGAPQSEFSFFREDFNQREPFFVFDAAPLAVVYTRTPQGNIKVMYFSHEAGKLVWSHTHHINDLDGIWEGDKEPLLLSASFEIPFGRNVIK